LKDFDEQLSADGDVVGALFILVGELVAVRIAGLLDYVCVVLQV